MWRKIYKITLIAIFGLFLNTSHTRAQQSTVSLFGMNAHLSLRYGDQPNTRQTAVDLMSEASIGWIREEFNWEEIQPISNDPDSIRWQGRGGQGPFNYDTAIELANENGLNILGLLTYGPRTNVITGNIYDKTDCMASQTVTVAPIESWLPDWRRFVRTVVERYGNTITHWEIGNEQNTECFWRKVDVAANAPNADDYVTILQAAAEEIRTIDSDAQIVLGGIVPPPGNDRSIDYFQYLKQIHDAGGWSSFDILAIHPYWSTFSPETIRPRSTFNTAIFSTQSTPIEYKFDEEIEAFNYMLDRLGEKPIWLTEYGWSEVEVSQRAAERSTTPALVQSDYLIRSTVMALSAGVENVMWYDFRNDASGDENQDTYGLVQRDFSRKLSYYAYKNMATLLAGSIFIEQVRGQDDRGGENDDDVYEYRFSNGNQMIIAIWKARGGGAARNVTINDITAETAAIYGPGFGSTVEPTSEMNVIDNSITLSLTERPQFVVFAGNAPIDNDDGDSDDAPWWENLPSLGDWWEDVGNNWQDWWQGQQTKIEDWWQEQQEAIARWMEEQIAQAMQNVLDEINRALSGLCATAILPIGMVAAAWYGRRSKKEAQG